MDARKRRIEIFKQVQDGRLSLEEASRLLAMIERGQEPEERTPSARSLMSDQEPINASGPSSMPGESSSAAPKDPPLDHQAAATTDPTPARAVEPVPPVVAGEVVSPGKHSPVWQGWWLLVFVPGLLLIVAAANWMYEGFLAARLGWGFWLSFIPFFLGILLVWIGWEIRMARWLYIHIRQRPGARPQELTLSVPLPTRWMSWLIRQVGRVSPHVNGTDLGDLMAEIDQAVAADGPLQISVDDPRGGQIEIWMDGPK